MTTPFLMAARLAFCQASAESVCVSVSASVYVSVSVCVCVCLFVFVAPYSPFGLFLFIKECARSLDACVSLVCVMVCMCVCV